MVVRIGVCLPLALKWWGKREPPEVRKLVPVRCRSCPDDEENQQTQDAKRNHVSVIRRKSDQGGRKEYDSNGGKCPLHWLRNKQHGARDDKHAEIVEQSMIADEKGRRDRDSELLPGA